MGDEPNCDLVDIATIYSRPELVCFTSALQAEGLFVYVCGDHFINATLYSVVCGGYRVRVPAWQREHAVELIAELRGETEPVATPADVRWGIRMLFGINLGFHVLMAIAAIATIPEIGVAAWAGLLGALGTVVPVTMAGDYLRRDGRMGMIR